MTTTSTILDTFGRARAVATPILSYSTPDPRESQASLLEYVLASEPDKSVPALSWDAVRGLQPLNNHGQTALQTLGLQQPQTVNLVVVLDAMTKKLPANALVFVHNAHKQWSKVEILQGVANVREPFKTDWRTLVLFHPGGAVPVELERDVVPITEPLPDQQTLARIVTDLHVAAKLPAPSREQLVKATSALAGLSTFTAEQATAMSLRTAGLDIDALRSRTRAQINATPGLKVEAGESTFDAIGGNANIKRYCQLIKASDDAPNAIVFVDEIEKQIGGAQNDVNQSTKNQLGTILQRMQDTKAGGIMAYGQPGVGKSEIPKALARELDTIVIRLDFGAFKGSLLGETEARTTHALDVIDAVGQGRVLWYATSNGLANLPGELKSRFTLGTFFFDLPTAEERAAIWAIHIKAFALTKEQLAKRPDDTDWTGREIWACCRNARMLKCTLADAAAYIVPVAKADAEVIDARRREAHGRYISASYAGHYRHPALEQAEASLDLLPTRARRSLTAMKES